MKKRLFCGLCLGALLTMSACSVQKIQEEKLRDLDYTVLCEEDIPEELQEQIQRKKMEEFRLTYEDQGILYLARGYGERETSGYQVELKACYETENALHIRTELLGPSKKEKIIREKTNPYIVVKLSSVGKNVMFE